MPGSTCERLHVAGDLLAVAPEDTSSAPSPASSAGAAHDHAPGAGSIVTGTGPGAGAENWMPVRSMRVDGPGHLAELDVVDEQGGDDVHGRDPTAARSRPASGDRRVADRPASVA